MTEPGRTGVGATLRDARDRAGLSLRQIADTTKLSMHVLTALEQDRIAQLPGGIYRRAIVRAFAHEVGLDAEATLRTFLENYPDEVPSAGPVPVVAAPGASRRLLRAIVSTFGAAIPIAAGVYYFSSSATGARPQHSPEARRAIDRPASGRTDVSATRAVGTADAKGTASMTITAAAKTRLQVIADGREVVARLFEAGEDVRVAFVSDVIVVGDDAGVVHLNLDGHDLRSLGAAGAPLNVRIPRDGYRDWLPER